MIPRSVLLAMYLNPQFLLPVDNLFLDIFTWTHTGSKTEFTSFLHKPLLFYQWYFLIFSCSSYWAYCRFQHAISLQAADIAACLTTFQELLLQLWDGHRIQSWAKRHKAKYSMGLLENVWLPDRKRAVEKNCSLSATPPCTVLKSQEDTALLSVHLIKKLPRFPTVSEQNLNSLAQY